MMVLVIKTTLLQRAAKLLGKDKLAVLLNVPEELLDAWMSGAVDMPDSRLPRLSAILTKAADKTRGGV
jgi:hypothetical protein